MTEETPPLKVRSKWPKPARRGSWNPVLGGLALFLLGLGAGYLVWGRTTPAVPSAAVADLNNAKRYNVPVDGSPSIGPENAPITLVEFSDYQCPFCTKWHDEVYEKLLNEYQGKIRFVYRNFPLSFHGDAQSAAEAAECAGDQDAYWKFHDALFSEKYGLGLDAYRQYASDLGLDVDALVNCVQSGKYTDRVKADAASGGSLGVNSTPTFFINGIAVVGAQPYEVFKQIIDQELAGKIQQ